MTYYVFPLAGAHGEEEKNLIAFCTANKINPRAPLGGSTFEVADELILTKEVYLEGGTHRVWHEGCCGSRHFAKTTGVYPLLALPDDFGFEPLRDADGNVAL